MRSGYTYDCENLALYRGQVASAMRGKRGQALLRDLLAALDAMPEKRLICGTLVDGAGEVCALGAVGKARGVADIDKIDPNEHHLLAERLNVAECLIREIEFENDEGGFYPETPEIRFERLRNWLVKAVRE